MDITEKIRDEIVLLSEKYKAQAADKYDFWEEHIKYVVKEALDLAAKNGADAEITHLGALLHDVSLMTQTGTRAEHHETGAKIAGEMLEKHNYPRDKAERVLKCVLNHRSAKNAASREELCVADADILAHFDNIPMLFGAIMNRSGAPSQMTLPEIRRRLKASFENDYNDLSEMTKKGFSARYSLICELILGG